MNRARLKTYAPKARLDFIRAVTDRARKIGLTATQSEPVTVSGDVAIILGQQFPRVVAEQRRRLDERIAGQGFHAVMEEVAYTWFNRFMAIRYLELHGYLEHGFRVLSHPDGKDRPEILEQAEHVALPGLDSGQVIALKLDGTKDEALYKLLLLAQCHALHAAMPFLFERIDDQTELLLPDNLLASDSILRKMVTEIAEADWEQIEVIGWLYQFYISEKKDEVIGKVVKSEDIPAATQLFTPNWIVKYMVQNSLGRQWMATYPHSSLKAKMEYYIEPAEQTSEVQAQLDAITPKELDPESLTLIDPACGSGHILCEAYDLFKELYLERGYRLRDIPRLILEKNLYGLDIDDRAAQMAGFALLMKARADDRRVLYSQMNFNVMPLQSSVGLDAQETADVLLRNETVELLQSDKLVPETNRNLALNAETTSIAHLQDLFALFANAKTFGSLLTVPPVLASHLTRLRALLEMHRNSPDLLKQNAVEDIEPLVMQAELLTRQYDVSVTNPPYMGSRGMNAELKDYTGKRYPNSKADLFAMFIERGFVFAKSSGYNALVTMQSWMFLSSYEALRKDLLKTKTLYTMVHLGGRAFAEISGDVVQVTAFVCGNRHIGFYKPVFLRAVGGEEAAKSRMLRDNEERHAETSLNDFSKIPGSPIAYWVSDRMRNLFVISRALGDVARPCAGLQTGDNARFLRLWHEVAISKVGFGIATREDSKNSQRKWFPYNKGGGYKKWYGNNNYIVNWESDGKAIHEYAGLPMTYSGAPVRAKQFYFREGITWSDITTMLFAARYTPHGFVFDVKGSSAFPEQQLLFPILGLLCSNTMPVFMRVLNPTVTFQVGDMARIPFPEERLNSSGVTSIAIEAVEISRNDWNAFETSWEFQRLPLLNGMTTVVVSFRTWETHTVQQRTRMMALEEENNRLFINAYGLLDELIPDVSDDQITLARADQEQDIQHLLSYAIGCMMGRYSLDEPGLIYAHSGNDGFDHARYTMFPADDDGILPLTDTDWFANQDTANRFAEFVKVAWPPESLAENLKFVAESLGSKAGEVPLETIRRYLCTGFYAFHLQTYKRRPIYWLFSSGKERAFQALVYLHRYNEGTLARMRMDCVVPLQSRMSARIDQLRQDIAASVTTTDRKKREKEREKLMRQLEELRQFDEKLRHYADRRISLDLDDGVKVNYGRFGDLLAEVKAVTGGNDP